MADVRLVEPGDRLAGPGLRRRRRPSTPRGGTRAGPARRSRCARRRTRDGRMPDPRTRPGMPDLYGYAQLLAEEKRRGPGRDVMSILLAQIDDDGGRVSDAEFENMFWLFAVAGNETLRNGLPGGLIALLDPPGGAGRAARRPALLPRRGGGDAALVDAGHGVPPDGDRATSTSPARPIRAGRQGGRLLHLGQPRRGGVPRPRPLRRPPPPQPAPRLRARTALLPRRAPGPGADAGAVRANCSRRTAWLELAGDPACCGPTSSAASSGCRCAGPPREARRADLVIRATCAVRLHR